jgi:methylenetetrahydrofolate dehydrogenase (NADP+)/methenyltetrahydrofolate cyclohydrolase
MELLDRYNVEIAGKHAVIVGRSNIVGKPLSLMLLNRDATVTICHSRTEDLGAVIRTADIVVAAVGVPKLVRADMIKDGAVVIDVGVNRLPDGTLCGDVDFEKVKEKAVAITPVPGGVGPMTIAMLLRNTLSMAKRHNSCE